MGSDNLVLVGDDERDTTYRNEALVAGICCGDTLVIDDTEYRVRGVVNETGLIRLQTNGGDEEWGHASLRNHIQRADTVVIERE
jgi:hypothetical protein